MAFLDTVFPDRLAYGSSGGGPMFNTTIVTSDSGGEQRIAKWSLARHKYTVTTDVTRDNMDEVRDLFYAAMGRLHYFRFHDVDDHDATDQPLSGAGATRQLTKLYDITVGSYSRKISLPKPGTVTLKRNGVAYTDFTLDTDTGIVTLTGLTTGTFTWSGEFHVPVRFDTDYFSPNMDDFDARSWSSISLVEVLI